MRFWLSVSLIVGVPLVAVSGDKPDPRALWARLLRQRAAVLKRSAPHRVRRGPPRTPEGLARCESPLKRTGDLPRSAGEAIRYHIDIDGLSVGTIDFKIERNGTFDGEQVTEYRSLFKIDQLLAAFASMDGRGAALVPHASQFPTLTTNRYNASKGEYQEDVSYSLGGRRVNSTRTRNGKTRKVDRKFQQPVQDFVSGYYALRGLPRGVKGCTLIYGNQRAYTIWIEPIGEEKIKTPVGQQRADVYQLHYGSEISRRPINAKVWISQDGARLPYRAEINGKHQVVARIHLFEAGRP